MKARSIGVIWDEWETRSGSQKGQYRLGYAETGVLLAEIARLNLAITRFDRSATATVRGPDFQPNSDDPERRASQFDGDEKHG